MLYSYQYYYSSFDHNDTAKIKTLSAKTVVRPKPFSAEKVVRPDRTADDGLDYEYVFCYGWIIFVIHIIPG